MSFREQWIEAARRKKSLLCVGIDAGEKEQRGHLFVPEEEHKVEWTLRIIECVAPYAAAIKLNRNYYKDISRIEMQSLNAAIHAQGMLSIDDSKLADIGETNDAGIYHAKREGFDAITYAPFPGNMLQAAEQGRRHDLGVIALVLMSNPEFRHMKSAQINGQDFYLYLADQAAEARVDGIVMGAPSAQNHITRAEIMAVAQRLPQALVLVPGIGAQGGELGPILEHFGERTLANVGRAIIYDPDPATQARFYRDAIAAQYQL
ncbi:MAG: orotidine 5'-phosphate decarboxylase [Oligoflexus sp.]|jgi:orotidine-5'-phosphate decarboxylase